MTKLTYTKDDGDKSTRDVEAIGFNFGERNKVLCIDYKGLTQADRDILEDVRRNYLDDLYHMGFGKNIRAFFLDNISEVEVD